MRLGSLGTKGAVRDFLLLLSTLLFELYDILYLVFVARQSLLHVDKNVPFYAVSSHLYPIFKTLKK